MAEHVNAAVAGLVVNAAASFLTNKVQELTGVSNKVEQLEWKLVEIQDAVEESNNFKIDPNTAVHKMQQKLMEIVQEGNEVLHEFKNRSSPSDPQRLDQAEQPELLQNPVSPGLSESFPSFICYSFFVSAGIFLCDYLSKTQKLNRVLERTGGASENISLFLEMVRRQKRKRQSRTMYRRPNKNFYKLAYLELAQDALGYWWVHVSWMQILTPEFVTFVETKAVLQIAWAEGRPGGEIRLGESNLSGFIHLLK